MLEKTGTPYVAPTGRDDYRSLQLPKLDPAPRRNGNYHTLAEFKEVDPQGHTRYLREAKRYRLAVPTDGVQRFTRQQNLPQDVRRKRPPLEDSTTDDEDGDAGQNTEAILPPSQKSGKSKKVSTGLLASRCVRSP